MKRLLRESARWRAALGTVPVVHGEAGPAVKRLRVEPAVCQRVQRRRRMPGGAMSGWGEGVAAVQSEANGSTDM